MVRGSQSRKIYREETTGRGKAPGGRSKTTCRGGTAGSREAGASYMEAPKCVDTPSPVEQNQKATEQSTRPSKKAYRASGPTKGTVEDVAEALLRKMIEMWEDIAKSKPKLEEELKQVGNQSGNTAETSRSRATEQYKDSDSEKGATLQKAGGQNNRETTDELAEKEVEHVTGGFGEESRKQAENEARNEVAGKEQTAETVIQPRVSSDRWGGGKEQRGDGTIDQREKKEVGSASATRAAPGYAS